jgi:hypothetical protein
LREVPLGQSAIPPQGLREVPLGQSAIPPQGLREVPLGQSAIPPHGLREEPLGQIASSTAFTEAASAEVTFVCALVTFAAKTGAESATTERATIRFLAILM